MNPDLLPQAMIAIGIVVLLVAVRVLVRQRRIIEMVPSSNVTIELPKKWDDAEVTRLLQRYHDQPTVLSHAVSSIKARMIMGQDLKTAQKRLQLIASVIELFKLNRELQGILYDVQMAEKDFEIRQFETQVRLEDVQARLPAERKLRQLRAQRDELQLQKEISQLQQDIDTTQNPQGSSQAQLSPEQQRRLRRMEIEDKLRELDRQQEEALKTARSDEDRVRIQNMYDDRREELREQLAKHLV